MIGVPTMLNEISWLEGTVSLCLWKYFMIIIIIIIIVITVIAISHLTIGWAHIPPHTLNFYNAFRNFWKCFFFLYLISKSHYRILNSQNIFRCIFCLCSFTILTKTRVAQFSAEFSISALVNFFRWCSRSSCLLSCLTFWWNLPLPLRGTNEDPSALSKTKQLKINQKTRKLKRCMESILNICCGQKSTGSLILNCCTVAFL